MTWLWLLLAIPIVWILRFAYRAATSRADYVYVEDDGSIRAITADEQAYLNEPFHFSDGGRPYIKGCYRALTPDGKISGYLERRHAPRHLRPR